MQNIENEDIVDTPDELTQLKARADMMGLSYHPSIGVEKLRDKIAAALKADGNGDTPATDADEPAAPVPETEDEKRARRRREASELVRIRVTCMNPLKKEWDGEIITAGNSAVGTFKKYIPFNADEGWHVPRIIYNQLLQRQCQVFYTVKDGRGNKTRRGKLTREFAIELLPQLTQDELDELARRQAMSKSID